RRGRTLYRPARRPRRAVRRLSPAGARLAGRPQRPPPLARAGPPRRRHRVAVRRRAVDRPASADIALGGLERGRGAHGRPRVRHRARRRAVGRGASSGPDTAAGAAARARLVSVRPALSLPSAPRSAPVREPQPLLAPRSSVQPVVRWALYAYICSIPFEMPGRSIPVEIPTLVGSVFLLATLLDRRAAYGRLPPALVAFVVYLWMFATASLLNLASHQLEVLHFFVEMVQLLLLFWTIANLLTDEPVRLGALRALAVAAGLMTFLGRGPTPWIRLRNAAAAVCVLGLLGLASFRSEAMRNRLFAAAETGNLAGRERIYPALLVMMRERPAIGWGPVE